MDEGDVPKRQKLWRWMSRMLKALQQSDLKVFKLVFTSCPPRFSKSNALFELLDIMPKVSMSKCKRGNHQELSYSTAEVHQWSEHNKNVFFVLSNKMLPQMAQSQSECRMGAIFLESLFLEQIGAVVDRTISRPLPHRCFAIFSQYSYYNTSNNIKNSLTMPFIFSQIHQVTISQEYQHILSIFL